MVPLGFSGDWWNSIDQKASSGQWGWSKDKKLRSKKWLNTSKNILVHRYIYLCVCVCACFPCFHFSFLITCNIAFLEIIGLCDMMTVYRKHEVVCWQEKNFASYLKSNLHLYYFVGSLYIMLGHPQHCGHCLQVSLLITELLWFI